MAKALDSAGDVPVDIDPIFSFAEWRTLSANDLRVVTNIRNPQPWGAGFIPRGASAWLQPRSLHINGLRVGFWRACRGELQFGACAALAPST
jgi:hypothetical protein